MLTSLDLLVIMSVGLAAVSLLGAALMFLVRTPVIRDTCFWLAFVMGLGVCAGSLWMFWPFFMGQAVLGLVLGGMSVAGVVLRMVNKKKFDFVARVLVAAAMILGSVNLMM